MTPLVAETEGLSRRFGSNMAVDGLDLSVPRGVVYGLLGPNGSGKTTAMRMLTGLLTPSGGRVEVLDVPLPAGAERLKQRIGYMTQGFTHYRDLTVRENLAFMAAIHRLPRRDARQRIDQLMDVYDLRDQAAALAGDLSGGQRQRLALAATVIHEPELLFLDEPTAAVDPETRRSFWERLFDLVDLGTTIVVSTHLMDEAERCHRIAILDRGRKRTDGAPRDLMAQAAGRVVELSGPDLRRVGRELTSAAGITSVAQIGTRLRVLVDTGIADAVRHVLDSLPRPEGIEAVEAAPNLEDVFVLATKGAKA